MSRIFISHSSADNDKALAIQQWMRDRGWDDVFLDFDPDRGLTGGASWQAQLKAAANRCEVVMLLLSSNWLASSWCMTEFRTAKMWSKAIIPVVIEPVPFSEISPEITNDHQLVDLTGGESPTVCRFSSNGAENSVAFSAQGLEALRKALRMSGIDPSYFDWPPAGDPDRLPFRGLNALTSEDAGIFFGRDGQLLAMLDRLRRIHDGEASQVLVVLGASGSGKSSFMRAGVLPRLRRMPETFLALDPLMPSQDPLFSEEDSLSVILRKRFTEAGAKGSLAAIRRKLREGPGALASLLSDLLKQAYPDRAEGNRLPTVILPVDQGEALFHPENAKGGKELLKHLNAALEASSVQLVVLITIRSDSFELLQSSEDLAGPAIELVDLPPLARGAYGEVIKGPLRRWHEADGKSHRTRFSDGLIDRLLQDMEKGGAKDALPLLAFTLERLLKDYDGEAVIGLEHYEQLGGIKGAIDAAVRQALSKAARLPTIPQDRTAQLALLKRGFIPWLAGFDPKTNSARRRVARYSEIPQEARPLIDHLVDERLLATDVDISTGEKTIEPAHEALLRQWGSLDGWIREDKEDLTAIDGLLRAVVEWSANDQEPQWIAHTAGRLETAEKAARRSDFANLLEPTDRKYLAEARRLEDQRKQREVRALRRQLFSAFALLLVLAVAVPLLWTFWSNANAALERESLQKELALSSANVALSKLALSEGREVEATRHAFAALQGVDTETTRSAALSAALAVSPHLRSELALPRDNLEAFTFARDNGLLLVWKSGGMDRYSPATAKTERLAEFDRDGNGGWKNRIVRVVETGNGRYVALRQDGNLVSADEGNEAGLAVLDGTTIAVLPGDQAVVNSTNGLYWAAISEENTVQTLRCADAADGLACKVATYFPSSKEGFLSALAFDESSGRLAVASENGAVVILDGETLAPQQSAFLDVEPISLTFQPQDPGLLFLGDRAGGLTVLGTGAGEIEKRGFLEVSQAAVAFLRASPHSGRVAASCGEKDICLLDFAQNPGGEKEVRLLTRLMGHDADVVALKWSPEDDTLASADSSGGLRTWALADSGFAHSELLTGVPEPLNAIAVSAEKAVLAGGSAAGTTFFWPLEGSATPASTLPAPPKVDAGVSGLDWAGDGAGRLVIVYDQYGFGLTTLGSEGLAVASFRDVPVSGALRAVWSADGNVSVVAGQKPGVTLYDSATLSTKSLMPQGDAQTLPFGMVATGPHEILTSETDGSLYRYDLENGRFEGAVKHAPIEGKPAPKAASTIAFSSQRNVVAVSNRPGRIGIYDLAEERDPISVKLPGSVAWEVVTVAFSPDSHWLAALDASGTLSVWDWRGGEPELFLSVPADALGTGRISPEGSSDAARKIAWADDATLALATAAGKIHLVSIDLTKWRRHLEGLWSDGAGG